VNSYKRFTAMVESQIYEKIGVIGLKSSVESYTDEL